MPVKQSFDCPEYRQVAQWLLAKVKPRSERVYRSHDKGPAPSLKAWGIKPYPTLDGYTFCRLVFSEQKKLFREKTA